MTAIRSRAISPTTTAPPTAAPPTIVLECAPRPLPALILATMAAKRPITAAIASERRNAPRMATRSANVPSDAVNAAAVVDADFEPVDVTAGAIASRTEQSRPDHSRMKHRRTQGTFPDTGPADGASA